MYLCLTVSVAVAFVCFLGALAKWNVCRPRKTHSVTFDPQDFEAVYIPVQ